MGKNSTGLSPYDRKREANIRLGTKALPDGLKAGQSVTLVLKGKVTSFSSEYGNSFSINISSIDVDSGMAGDMKKIKSKRTMGY